MDACNIKNYDEYTNSYLKELGMDLLNGVPTQIAYQNFIDKLKNLQYDYYFSQDIVNLENCIKSQYPSTTTSPPNTVSSKKFPSLITCPTSLNFRPLSCNKN